MSSPYMLPVATSANGYGGYNPYAIYGYQNAGGFAPYAPYGPYNGSQDLNQAFSQGGQFINPDASMEDIYATTRNQISGTGNALGRQAGQQLNYYGPWQQEYQQAGNAALNQLAQTPGYTPEEAGQINVNYGQYVTSPEQWDQINQNLQQGIAGEGAQLNAYQQGLGGTLSDYSGNLGGATSGYQTGIGDATRGYQSDVSGAVGAYGEGVRGALGQGRGDISDAVGGLQGGLAGAQDKFGKLDTAVNDPSLGFDPNSTEKQMTDEDVANLVASAGTTVGNQFQAQRDALERRAAAEGNTSPAALAAMERDMVTQQAATAGDAMTNARINALQAQYQRAAGIEGQRLGASQAQQGMRATAATTEQQAAQQAAALGGQAGINAAQYLTGAGLQGEEALGQANLQGAGMAGQAGMTGAALSGQAGINAANTMGQANLGALAQYYPLAVNQANTMTGQQYGAGLNQANTQYGQGMGAAQATAGGASNVGQARMGGQAQYRSGVAQQQGMAQQGGQAAQQAQLGAYGTQTGGLTSSAAGQGAFETNKASFGDSLARGAAGLLTGHAEGDVITEPTVAKIAERGPELVVPLSKYKSRRQNDEECAA